MAGSPNCSDYRPISLLPIISKVAEKFIQTQLQKFTDPILSSRQFGFRSGQSTVDALATLEYQICLGFEKCKSKPAGSKATQVCGIFFDVKKAFNSVPHHLLLQCLRDNFKVPDFILCLLQDYLSGRKQTVRVDGKCSSPRDVKSGVPQGSVLGPVMFVAYVDIVANLYLSPNADLIFYADDLFYTKPLLSAEDFAQVQADVDTICASFQQLGLSLNASKTKQMIFSLRPDQANVPNCPIRIGGNEVEKVSSYKYLGIWFDPQISFQEHAIKTAAKTRQALGCLSRTTRKYVLRRVLNTIYQGVILPASCYGSEVFIHPGQGGVGSLELMEKSHRFAARIVSNNYDWNCTHPNLLAGVGWKPFSQICSMGVKDHLLLESREWGTLLPTRCCPASPGQPLSH